MRTGNIGILGSGGVKLNRQIYFEFPEYFEDFAVNIWHSLRYIVIRIFAVTRLEVLMIQRSAVMTSRRSASAAFDVQIINHHQVSTSFKLVFVSDPGGLMLVVSQGRHVRQVTFAAEDVGDDIQSFLAVQDPATVASRVVSNIDPQELDDDQFFIEVEQRLAKLHSRSIMSDATLEQLKESLSYWRDGCNTEGLINELHLENLSDVVADCAVFKAKDEEVEFWQAIWKSVINKSSAMTTR